MKKKPWNITMAIACIAVLAVFAVPVLSEAATVTAVYAPGATNPLDPADPAWNAAPVTTDEFKHINYVETGCGSGTLYEKRMIDIRALHNGTSIFFRFDWIDPTRDLSVADPSLFSDAMGLQVPIAGNTQVQMGSQNNPVNIILWRADWDRPQNIVAGGIGTVQKSPDAASQNIVHSQRWLAGVWTVIMSRPMSAASENQVTFTRGMRSTIAFMNVDGSDCERNGHKTISMWDTFVVQ